MKKALKVLIPLVLIIALIACAVWYLLVYDREFTRDMLLAQARRFEADGNQKAAAWMYDLAYSHASNDSAIAIELAEQYLSGGNYTKAEATLSGAISDNPSADLYIALCDVYVRQDKLLDAVTMLDNVPDPGIKAELDALRPTVPTPDAEPGFYSQYITVTLSSSGGKLYVTTNGLYPSTEHLPSDGSVSLGIGETTIYSLCVGDNGLVSPLGIYGYTVAGVVEPVTFADPAVEAAVRALLEVDGDTVIFTNDLWNITVFDMPAEAATYEDLTLLTHLTELFLPEADQSQLHCISSLQKLKTLIITDSRPAAEDLTLIANLPALESLTMYNCGLSSIAGLERATNLKYLDLRSNSLRNLEAISQLTGLQALYLSNNALVDLEQLRGLTGLKTLDVAYNNLTTLEPIAGISNLEVLTAGHNQLSSISVLGNLLSLREVELAHNNLTDISALGACTGLTRLDFSNNTITDISSLAGLTKLSRLYFSYNQVTTLPQFSQDSELVTIDGSYNLITALDTLAGLPYLNNVLMDYNPEITTVEPLDDCPLLIQVNVYGTQVTEVSFLTDKSVIVNFNPTDVEATVPNGE